MKERNKRGEQSSVNPPRATDAAARRKRAPSSSSPRKKKKPPPPSSDAAASSSSSSEEEDNLSDADDESNAAPKHHMYGQIVPKRPEETCAGCLGERNEELKDDAILLCDGGCGSEYHMSCCLPQLTKVPEGSYFCFDCDPDGSTAQLKQYIDGTAHDRSLFKTSRDFVEFHLKNAHNYHYPGERPRFPRSEFDRISQSLRDVAFTTQGKAKSDLPEDESSVGPEFLVGKPVQLYCPEGNQYHHGRILDWRRANHLEPISVESLERSADAFHGSTEIAQCEFFVSFPAGMDYRKTPYRQWMILEEHCLAVATSLVWGEMTRKRGILGWMPAQVWLRTSLELIPAQHELLEREGQIHFMDKPPPSEHQRIWALTEFLGESQHALLSLREESVDFSNQIFAKQRLEKASSPSKANASLSERCEIAMSLARAELEEQQRARKWYSMPLENAAHNRALTIADESVLPSVTLDAPTDTVPKPCQLIPKGLDRMYIIEMLEKQGGKMTKDTAASITCERVESITAAIQHLDQL
jgi:hypothetical protein